MHQYLDLMKYVHNHGTFKNDRTGVGTYSIFGYQMRFNLENGFPLLTTKRLHFKSIIHELIWFLTGSTNISYLKNNNVKIWNEWADAKGDLGPIYGYQWRSWSAPNDKCIDQITEVINQIRNNPNSRRLIVSTWNVADIPYMRLPPCHILFQFYVANNKLSCQLYQRSADIFLGIPFNIASYALLTHMIAQQSNLTVGDLIWTGGDCHLYKNHLKQAREQMIRIPGILPKLQFLKKPKSIFNYIFEDIIIINYTPQPHITAPVAI